LDYDKANAEILQIKHELKVMGNARKHMETKDLVNKIDNGVADEGALSPKELILLKNSSFK